MHSPHVGCSTRHELLCPGPMRCRSQQGGQRTGEYSVAAVHVTTFSWLMTLSRTQSGRTALIWAAFNGHEGCVKILLAAGPEKDIQEKVTLMQCHPMIDAADDLWSPWQSGYTALIAAAYNGREGCLKALLDAGADADLQDGDGSTALILAASNGHEGCVELLAEAGADKSIKNNDGDTALSLASTPAIKVILRGW